MKNLILCSLFIDLFTSSHSDAAISTFNVVELGAKNFENEVSTGFWLIEFYAPWCGHCKRLNPILDAIVEEANLMGMHIGKVDVTRNKGMAEKFSVTGFPTLKFTASAPEPDPKMWKTYEGGRSAKDLLAFASRMASNPLPAVHSQEMIYSELLAQSASGVVFLLGLGEGEHKIFGADSGEADCTDCTNEDGAWAIALAKSVQHRAVCGILSPPRHSLMDISSVMTDGSGPGASDKEYIIWNGFGGPSGDKQMTWNIHYNQPFLMKIEAGEKPKHFPGSLAELKEANDKQAVTATSSRILPSLSFGATLSSMEEWILENDAPLLNVFGVENFRKLGKRGKLLVIAVVDPAKQITKIYLETLQKVARKINSQGSSEATGNLLSEYDPTMSTSITKNRKSFADTFIYGSLDGIHFGEFVRQFNVIPSAMPRLVVFDMPNEIFYEDIEVDEEDEIETFLREIHAGRVPVQHSNRGLSGTLSRFWGKLKSMQLSGVITLFGGVPILLILAWMIRPRRSPYQFGRDSNFSPSGNNNKFEVKGVSNAKKTEDAIDIKRKKL